MPNAPLAYALGKEFHPPILITLAMHGSQVNIYIEKFIDVEETSSKKLHTIIDTGALEASVIFAM